MSQVLQIICVSIGVLVLAVIVLRQLIVVLQRRTQNNDPLRYLRGKSREEIRQFLITPVYGPPPKTRHNPKRTTKQTD